MLGSAVSVMTLFDFFNKEDLNQVNKEKLLELHELQTEQDSMR